MGMGLSFGPPPKEKIEDCKRKGLREILQKKKIEKDLLIRSFGVKLESDFKKTWDRAVKRTQTKSMPKSIVSQNLRCSDFGLASLPSRLAYGSLFLCIWQTHAVIYSFSPFNRDIFLSSHGIQFALVLFCTMFVGVDALAA